MGLGLLPTRSDHHEFPRVLRLAPICFAHRGIGVRTGISLAHSLFYGLHQVLKIGKDVGIGFVPVFGHHLSINNHIELPVGARGEFEGADMFTHPAQSFSCHPGSTQGVASIPAVEYF